jgi:hypothetical protein
MLSIKESIFYFLWILLCLPVTIFIYVIITLFITQPPTEWSNNTDNMLPGLGNLYIPAFGMYLHFIGGVIIMICGIFQILPIIRKRIIIHRIIGNIYVYFSILTGIGGNIFIYTNGTTGGINMDIAFSIAGWLMIILAIVAYYYARIKNIQKHKEWAIRSWALCYSSIFYRIIYFIVGLFGYYVTSPDDFLRPLDSIIDWLFFFLPLLFAELYIRRNWIILGFMLMKKLLRKIVQCKKKDTLIQV